MTLASNPYVKAELDNLQLQFGHKALLTLDDYCTLFSCKRVKAAQHMRRRGVPHKKVGQDVYIPILDLALFLAQKQAAQEGRVIAVTSPKEASRSKGGFARKAHETQLVGRK
ncbi:MAG: hypothetical protein FWB91_00340 [Defluviitaleaceae bacterium]|nr:hypothetical protein [Defluviitaleaceae bacterium]